MYLPNSNPKALPMRLYVRIWLAIVLTVTVVVLVVGFFVKQQNQHLREEFKAQMREQRRELGLPERPLRPPRLQRPAGLAPPWYVAPWGFGFLLVVIAAAVALGAYPVVRRLTRRLEALQQGVERWGKGHLSERVTVEGKDEVAFLAAQFNQAAAHVETLLTSHKALLANASHELRSPLARIRMGLEVGDNAEIKRNITELDSLIEEILLASRLDAPGADFGPTEVIDLMGLAAEECARVDAELEAGVATQGQFDLQGYPKLMRRLLRNLLENAVKFNNPEKGHATLALTHAKNPAGKAQIVITVRDHGPGVAPSEVALIFEPFYRAKHLQGTGEGQPIGVGLGLSLVQSIAKQHGGSVVCIPEPGAGACFVATFESS
jgi:two-component system, OmpR family, sensor kinase